MFHFEVRKYSHGDIAVESGFADIRFEKVFTFDFTEDGAGRNFIFNDPFFYIVDERKIVAELNVGAFGGHIEFIFVVSFIRAIPFNEFIMSFTVHIGIRVFFAEVFAALDFLIDGGKGKAEFVSNKFNFEFVVETIF